MNSYERVEFTNMCMIMDAQGRVVLQHRTGSWPGYAFPGGHVENGEPFTDSVIREVREETGLTIEHPMLCGVKDWMKEDGARYVVLLYRADTFTGTLTSSSEGDVAWYPMSALDTMPLSRGMCSTLDFFLDPRLSEQFFDADKDYAEIRK